MRTRPLSGGSSSSGDYLPLTGGTLTGDLKFTDATYDIGKAGATRPRDGFFSRNLTVGGTITGPTDAETGSAVIRVADQMRVDGYTVVLGPLTATNYMLRLANSQAISGSGVVNGFSSVAFGTTSALAAGLDTGLSRIAAGVVGVGTGAAGAVDGTLKANLQSSVNATTGLSAGVLAGLTNASIVIKDGAGQLYRVPCII